MLCLFLYSDGPIPTDLTEILNQHKSTLFPLTLYIKNYIPNVPSLCLTPDFGQIVVSKPLNTLKSIHPE